MDRGDTRKLSELGFSRDWATVFYEYGICVLLLLCNECKVLKSHKAFAKKISRK